MAAPEPRIIALENAPPIPDPGFLNHTFNSMRSMGDKYSLDHDYANYLINFRAEVTPKEMLDENKLLRQEHFQPSSIVPTCELVQALAEGIVRYGIRKEYWQKIAKEFLPKGYPLNYLDVWFHMMLGVVDLKPYYNVKFNDVASVHEARRMNLDKARQQDKLWGVFFWNVQHPPVPRAYEDIQGNFSLEAPLENMLDCQLRREYERLGWCEPLDRTPSQPRSSQAKSSRSRKKASKSTPPVRSKRESLLRYGFSKTAKKPKKSKK